MIGDKLYEAVTEIERYQRDYPKTFGRSTEAIQKVKVVMNALRSYLDLPHSLGSHPRYDAAMKRLRKEIDAIDVEGVAAALEDITASWPTPHEVDAEQNEG